MKVLISALFFFSSIFLAKAQQSENLIIITTDGFRWQEFFGGMDKELANEKAYNQNDSLNIYRKYWSEDASQRRQQLLPFVWNTIASHGQIYGNRWLGNKVDVSNPYWFSYPGYSEIMCGYVDTNINKNSFPSNPNTTLLDFLNRQKTLTGKVAAFGAWGTINRILHKERSTYPVVAAWDHFGGKTPNANEQLINRMLDQSAHMWNEECYDVFTHFGAMETLKNKKPRVLYISYGETDEYAHERHYRSYLDAAHQVDAWIKEIWDFVQSDPQYKNKTTLFFTTDHGRGDKVKSKWNGHGQSVEDSHEIWFAVMGPNVPAKGEMKNEGQLYQKQFAQTIARLMGYTYTAEHPVGEEVSSVLK